MKRSRESDDAVSGTVDEQSSAAEEVPSKILETEGDEDPTGVEMRCSLPPHRGVMVFRTYREYDIHYIQSHSNRCFECRKNFPSAHILELHIEENHDSMVAVKRDRGERTFSCFVEGCDKKCRSFETRRLHLIDKHMYPRNYFFAVTRNGIDGRQSLLQSNRHRQTKPDNSTKTTTTGQLTLADVEVLSSAEKSGIDPSSSGADDTAKPEGDPDVEMGDLTQAMSALRFVPTSIRFGRGKGKAGFAKRQLPERC